MRLNALVAHPWLAFALIFFVSFGMRFAILMKIPQAQLGSGGEASHIAETLIAKRQYADPFAVPTGPTAHLTPFYPVLLSGMKIIFGSGSTGGLAQSLFVIAAYSLLYALYPRFASGFGFPVSAGILAGLLSALLPVKRATEVFRGWEEPYAAITLAFLLGFTLRCWQKRDERYRTALLLGASWGLALYVSATLASILIGLLAVDIAYRRSWRGCRNALLVILGAAVVIAPWIIRNRVALGGWTFMRTGLGQNLRCSNHDGVYASIELINAHSDLKQMYALNSAAESRNIRSMGELAYDRHQRELAFEWIRWHPGRFALLSAQRCLYFWGGPQEHSFELLVTSAYTILGLCGLALMRRRVGALVFRMWCTTLATYPVVYYFVQYAPRYRVAIDWMIWLSAGLAVAVVLEQIKWKPAPHRSNSEIA
ncbi:MAG TPA: hypothetical protein VMU05_20050 [Dongiaceae bacterium]|nr:hypothetical protein [Dongiaceae bacterium]